MEMYPETSNTLQRGTRYSKWGQECRHILHLLRCKSFVFLDSRPLWVSELRGRSFTIVKLAVDLRDGGSGREETTTTRYDYTMGTDKINLKKRLDTLVLVYDLMSKY